MYQKNQDGKYVLAWDLSIEEISQEDWWSIRVDASTGEILEKISWKNQL